VTALTDDHAYARIKIDNVTNYSFGLDDGGRPVIWAAGKAGWYELMPSDRYVSHYNDTVEAIDLFYFMVDQQQKLPPKRQRFGFTVDPFLTEYQKHTDYRIDDDDEAMETIHKHHKFLLKQMIEEREGIDWSQTYLWKHLAETYADEVHELKTSLAATESRNGEPAVEETEENPIHTQTEPAETSADSAEPSEAASESTSSHGEEEPNPIDWTKPIWDLLNVLRKSANFNIRHCGIEELASELVKIPAFEGSHADAVAAIERSAAPLLRLMNEAKLRKKFNWSTRRIYDELEATLADEIAEEILKTPAAKSGKQRHRMKSVLRPSGAGKAHKRARGAPDSQDEDEEMGGGEPSATFPPVAKRNPPLARRVREASADSVASREDSPSRQLNGHLNPHALPELPPPPEAQEMLDLVAQEAKRVGRQHQTNHLKEFLGQWGDTRGQLFV